MLDKFIVIDLDDGKTIFDTEQGAINFCPTKAIETSNLGFAICQIKAIGKVKLVTWKKSPAHDKSYQPWTNSQSNELRRRFKGGENIDTIARYMGRSSGAIWSQLKKLL